MTDEWDELLPVKQQQAAKEPVRVGVTLVGRQRAPRLAVYVRGAILAELGGRAMRYRLSLGKGATRHMIRVVQDDAGPFEACELGKHKGGGVFRLLLPPIERIPACRIAALGAKYEVAKKRHLLITLPPWAWDDNEKRRAEKQLGSARPIAEADALKPIDAIAKLLDAATRERLSAMAVEAGKPVNRFAAELITSVVEEDAVADAEEEVAA